MDWLDRSESLPFCYARTNRPATSHYELYQKFESRGDISPWRALRQESHQTDHEVTMVSAEGLSRLTPPQIDDILTELHGESIRLQAVAFLRPPASFAVSMFNQQLKSGRTLPLPDVESTVKVFEDRIENLAHWCRRLGPENMSIVPFPGGPDGGDTLWARWWEAVGIAEPVPLSSMPPALGTLNLSPPLPVLATLFQLAQSWNQRHTKRTIGYRFYKRITEPMSLCLHAIAGTRFDRSPVLFESSEVEGIEERCRPSLERRLRPLGHELPFFPQRNASSTPSDSLWFTNPNDPRLPVEGRRIVAHLIEYGESLAAEEI